VRFQLERVVTFPKALCPGVLYYSEEFKTSRHVCACGCGDIIKLPIDHMHHRITEAAHGPTLRPSVGNWDVCDAHYYVTDGQVEWLPRWSQSQITAGRRAEDQRRERYFNESSSFFLRFRKNIAKLAEAAWRCLADLWRK
jgi:hypothetical protein